jgi:hypothetical protein
MSKITVTKTFTSKSLSTDCAVNVKVGRKNYDLNRTSADDISAWFDGKFEVSVDDLRNIAAFLLFRLRKNEYSRNRANDAGFKTWFQRKNPTKDYSQYKAGLTKKANTNRQAYDKVCAIGKAMTA